MQLVFDCLDEPDMPRTRINSFNSSGVYDERYGLTGVLAPRVNSNSAVYMSRTCWATAPVSMSSQCMMGTSFSHDRTIAPIIKENTSAFCVTMLKSAPADNMISNAFFALQKHGPVIIRANTRANGIASSYGAKEC